MLAYTPNVYISVEIVGKSPQGVRRGMSYVIIVMYQAVHVYIYWMSMCLDIHLVQRNGLSRYFFFFSPLTCLLICSR